MTTEVNRRGVRRPTCWASTKHLQQPVEASLNHRLIHSHLYGGWWDNLPQAWRSTAETSRSCWSCCSSWRTCSSWQFDKQTSEKTLNIFSNQMSISNPRYHFNIFHFISHESWHSADPSWRSQLRDLIIGSLAAKACRSSSTRPAVRLSRIYWLTSALMGWYSNLT